MRRNVSAALLAAFFFIPGEVQREDFPPPGWSALTGRVEQGREDYDMFVDRQVKYKGKASICVKSNTTEPKSSALLVQFFAADDYRAKRVRMTAYVKSDDLSSKSEDGGAGLWLRIDGEKKELLGADFMRGRRITGTTAWQRYAVVLDVPEAGAEIWFGLFVRGAGRVWCDDFSFEIVGPDVATTGEEQRLRDRTRPPTKDLPKQPKNLGFED